MNPLTDVYNEDSIMSSFREGDKESFSWVFNQMSRPLSYFVENIIHSQVDAEDIIANAFYKLFHAKERMKSFEHIKRWLYVIVRNEAIDFLRFKTKQRECKNDFGYLLDEKTENQIELERIKTMLFQNILKEIENLPRQRRTILRLYFFEQKTTHEIAEITHLNPQTVLNHKAKALESLRKTSFDKKYTSVFF